MAKNSGITKGKSHKEGGIPMEVKSTGQKIEVEGGEGIVNKYAMSNTETFKFDGEEKTSCEIISDLNQKKGDGVSFECDTVENKKYKFKKGGELQDLVWNIKDTSKVYIPTTFTEEEIKKEIQYFNDYYRSNDKNNEWVIGEDFEKTDDGKNWTLYAYNPEESYAKGGSLNFDSSETFYNSMETVIKSTSEFLSQYEYKGDRYGKSKLVVNVKLYNVNYGLEEGLRTYQNKKGNFDAEKMQYVKKDLRLDEQWVAEKYNTFLDDSTYFFKEDLLGKYPETLEDKQIYQVGRMGGWLVFSDDGELENMLDELETILNNNFAEDGELVGSDRWGYGMETITFKEFKEEGDYSDAIYYAKRINVLLSEYTDIVEDIKEAKDGLSDSWKRVLDKKLNEHISKNKKRFKIFKEDDPDFEKGGSVRLSDGSFPKTTLVANVIFSRNHKNSKISTTFGDKTENGLRAMINNDSYSSKEVAKSIFEYNEKNGKIETAFGNKTLEGLTALVQGVRDNSFAKGGSLGDRFKEEQEWISRDVGKRYMIYTEKEGEKPTMRWGMNHKSDIKGYVEYFSNRFPSENVFVVDNKEDRQIYDYAKGGNLSDDTHFVIQRGNKRLSSVYSNELGYRHKWVGYSDKEADDFGKVKVPTPNKIFVFRENSWITFDSKKEAEDKIDRTIEDIKADDRYDDKIKNSLIKSAENLKKKIIEVKKLSRSYAKGGKIVWVGDMPLDIDGREELTEEEAERLAKEWKEKGYDDVIIVDYSSGVVNHTDVDGYAKGGSTYAEGGEVSRSDMEEWFYEHDNEWQNDIDIDHQQEDTNLDLVEWAYNRYHYAKGGKTYAAGGEMTVYRVEYWATEEDEKNNVVKEIKISAPNREEAESMSESYLQENVDIDLEDDTQFWGIAKVSTPYAEGGVSDKAKGIDETRRLIDGFEKRYGKILPLNYKQIKEDVKKDDVWDEGGKVFVGLSVESGVDGDNLKVGQVNPNHAYITFGSHINKSGVGDGASPDVARTYDIHLEISGRKRYTQRTYDGGTYYKVVNYGRTINDLLDKIQEGMEGLLILDSITPVLKLTYQGINFKKGGDIDDGYSYDIEYEDEEGDEYSESFNTLQEARDEIKSLKNSDMHDYTIKRKYRYKDGEYLGSFERGGETAKIENYGDLKDELNKLDKAQLKYQVGVQNEDTEEYNPIEKIADLKHGPTLEYEEGGDLWKPSLFMVSGYFKDDKSEFNDYLIYEFDDVPKGYDDDDIFYYGLSETNLKNSSENDGMDFVITEYRRLENYSHGGVTEKDQYAKGGISQAQKGHDEQNPTHTYHTVKSEYGDIYKCKDCGFAPRKSNFNKGGSVPNKEETRKIANEIIAEYKKLSKLSPSKRIQKEKWELNEESLEAGSFEIDLNGEMGDGGSYYIKGDEVILASMTPQQSVYNWKKKYALGGALKYAPLNTVKVIFKNPKYNYSTNVSAITNEEQARKYFVGQIFNVGSYPKEKLEEVINIEYIKGTDYAKGGKITNADGETKTKEEWIKEWEEWQEKSYGSEYYDVPKLVEHYDMQGELVEQVKSDLEISRSQAEELAEMIYEKHSEGGTKFKKGGRARKDTDDILTLGELAFKEKMNSEDGHWDAFDFYKHGYNSVRAGSKSNYIGFGEKDHNVKGDDGWYDEELGKYLSNDQKVALMYTDVDSDGYEIAIVEYLEPLKEIKIKNK